MTVECDQSKEGVLKEALWFLLILKWLKNIAGPFQVFLLRLARLRAWLIVDTVG